MSERWRRRVREFERIEYILPSPATGYEVRQVLDHIKAEMVGSPVSDDTVWTKTDKEGAMIFYYEREKSVVRKAVGA